MQLSFTEKGNDIFGFGSVYPGTFDLTSPDNFPRFVASEGDGGLAGLNEDGVTFITMADQIDPPMSNIAELSPIFQFGIGVDDPVTSLDRLTLFYGPASNLSRVRVEGHFLPVPEPHINACCLVWFWLLAIRWFGKRMAP